MPGDNNAPASLGIIKLNNEKQGFSGGASSQVVSQLGPELKKFFFNSFKESWVFWFLKNLH